MVSDVMTRAVLILSLVLGIPSARSADQHCESPPTVAISNVHLEHQALKLNWIIKNSSHQVVYVYASFLRGGAAAWAAGADGVDYKLYTSQPERLHIQVNSYPEAVFFKILPGGEFKGAFSDSHPAVHIAKGSKLLFVVAYGADPEDVKKEIRRSFFERDGFAANPIVDWQCLALSNVDVVR